MCPAEVRPTIPAAEAPIAQLWQPPLDVSTRDLYYGPWGPESAPTRREPTRSLTRKRTDSTRRRRHRFGRPPMACQQAPPFNEPCAEGPARSCSRASWQRRGARPRRCRRHRIVPPDPVLVGCADHRGVGPERGAFESEGARFGCRRLPRARSGTMTTMTHRVPTRPCMAPKLSVAGLCVSILAAGSGDSPTSQAIQQS